MWEVEVYWGSNGVIFVWDCVSLMFFWLDWGSFGFSENSVEEIWGIKSVGSNFYVGF